MARPRADLTGQKFNMLTVVGFADSPKYLCKCECGTVVKVAKSNLQNGNTKSCGCLRKQKASLTHSLELTNRRFGKLICLNRAEQTKDGSVVWSCKCDCGNHVEVSSRYLIRGSVNSCGCLTQSLGEMKIETFLKDNNISYSKEYTTKDTGKLRFDFAIYTHSNELKMLIEFDGIQHFKAIDYWQGEQGLVNQKANDEIKNKWCKENNIYLMRIKYTEINQIEDKLKEELSCSREL